MGMILLKYGLRTKRLPVLESNGFGRSQELGLRRIPVKGLPLFWLEIRWLGNQWVWRVLNAENETKGRGPLLSNGWRELTDRIIFQSTTKVQIELFDGSPPGVLVESLQNSTIVPVDEVRGLHVSDLGYRVDLDQPLLQNGEVFVLEGHPYRLWIPQSYAPSIDSSFMVTDSDMTLDIFTSELRAEFSIGQRTVSIQGEFVRVLWVYAQERVDGEGWLDSQEALHLWIAFGGNSNSEAPRVSWERNKLRQALVDQQVFAVDNLFERFRQGVNWHHRLIFESTQITIVS